MNKLYYLVFILLLIGCESNENALNVPSNISNIRAMPDTGKVMVSWDMPADSSFLYLKVSTQKYPASSDSSELISTKVSKYADSAIVSGLLHKYKYTFKVQPFNADFDHKKQGKILTSRPIRPIRRAIDSVYYGDSLTKINVTPNEITGSSVDPSNDVASNLIDGDINTFWQTDWKNNPHPAPFYVQFNFDKKVSVGAIKYNFRQFRHTGPRAAQFGLMVSKDGESWGQVWMSKANLPITPVDQQMSLNMSKNYTSKHFRVMILSTNGGATSTSLSELVLYHMKVEKIDEEKHAENNY